MARPRPASWRTSRPRLDGLAAATPMGHASTAGPPPGSRPSRLILASWRGRLRGRLLSVLRPAPRTRAARGPGTAARWHTRGIRVSAAHRGLVTVRRMLSIIATTTTTTPQVRGCGARTTTEPPPWPPHTRSHPCAGTRTAALPAVPARHIRGKLFCILGRTAVLPPADSNSFSVHCMAVTRSLSNAGSHVRVHPFPSSPCGCLTERRPNGSSGGAAQPYGSPVRHPAQTKLYEAHLSQGVTPSPPPRQRG